MRPRPTAGALLPAGRLLVLLGRFHFQSGGYFCAAGGAMGGWGDLNTLNWKREALDVELEAVGAQEWGGGVSQVPRLIAGSFSPVALYLWVDLGSSPPRTSKHRYVDARA